MGLLQPRYRFGEHAHKHSGCHNYVCTFSYRTDCWQPCSGIISYGNSGSDSSQHASANSNTVPDADFYTNADTVPDANADSYSSGSSGGSKYGL